MGINLSKSRQSYVLLPGNGRMVTNKYVKFQYLKGYRKYAGWYKKLNQNCDADADTDADARVSRIALLLYKYNCRARNAKHI